MTVLLAAAAGVATGNPGFGLVLGVFAGSLVAALLFGFLTFLSWVLGKPFSRHPSQGLPPDASGNAAQHLASADSAGPPSQISHDPQHTAEVRRASFPARYGPVCGHRIDGAPRAAELISPPALTQRPAYRLRSRELASVPRPCQNGGKLRSPAVATDTANGLRPGHTQV